MVDSHDYSTVSPSHTPLCAIIIRRTTGSIAELNAILNRQTNADELRDLCRRCAAEAPLKGVMGVFEEEWPSARIVGEPLSSVVHLLLVQVMGGDFVSVAAR